MFEDESLEEVRRENPLSDCERVATLRLVSADGVDGEDCDDCDCDPPIAVVLSFWWALNEK